MAGKKKCEQQKLSINSVLLCHHSLLFVFIRKFCRFGVAIIGGVQLLTFFYSLL